MAMQGIGERGRMQEAHEQHVPWRKWGPYLSERQWGTVREDYSDSGDAWGYFPHDQARSRAYRWGEDGLAGISDDHQLLCFSVALWNERDAILKERLFGLTNSEGNHGEDVKEYYFYLDSTPSHSYMRYLYKYPQGTYPYTDLVATNGRRNRAEFEYELLDTGIFDENRYFDVFVQYAKISPDDILVRIDAVNRGPQAAPLHLLPTLWFRNTWSWGGDDRRPLLELTRTLSGAHAVAASHAALGPRYLYIHGAAPVFFTENETNNERLFGAPNRTPYVKDGIGERVVRGREEAVNPALRGTKAAAHHRSIVAPGEMMTVKLRLSDAAPLQAGDPFLHFDDVLQQRRAEADEFYHSLAPAGLDADAAQVMRQALGGMLWSKQYFGLDMDKWLREHGARATRNNEWLHLVNDQIISMPDKWEYPWYAAWDLAFQAIPLAEVDVDFAKEQLDLMLRENYLHPSGQIPAYEWNFSDVNPPVHAWATMFLYRTEQAQRGEGDLEFLKRSFLKLAFNFGWWVNRKDRSGHNLFEGGFLGLDNIGVFDRSAPLPTGGHLEQADGTAWVSLYCQNMLEMGLELSAHDPYFEDMAVKFAEHFLWIANAMNQIGAAGMWDEEDGFYYDVLRFPDGSGTRLKVRSLVGLLPMCATTIIEPWERERVPRVSEFLAERVRRMPQLREGIHPTGAGYRGHGGRDIVSLVNPQRLRRILARLLDEKEFLSPFGIRSLSRYHADHPYAFHVGGSEYRVAYAPAESDSAMFGGNSNWRGPIWFPMNVLVIRALLSYYLYYGDELKVECPTGSGHWMTLFEVAREISHRLTAIFLKDTGGRRPVYGGMQRFQTDPHWKDYVLFHEYFHGDNGAGLGASHQTGWTGLVAPLMRMFARLDAAEFLESGKLAPHAEVPLRAPIVPRGEVPRHAGRA